MDPYLKSSEQRSKASSESEEMATEVVDPPKILWHYTTASGLLGILREGAIRATGLSYLNDITEGKYLRGLMREPIEHLTSKDDLPGIEKLFESAYRRFGAACFCPDGDLLSQWRGYSGGGGFAIGFKSQLLRQFWEGESWQGFLRPVEYSSSTSFLRAVVDAREVTEEYHRVFPGGINSLRKDKEGKRVIYESEFEDMKGDIAKLFQKIEYLAFNGALHKDEHFSEEREWRLLTFIDSKTQDDEFAPDVGVGRQGLTIYRRIAFQSSFESSPICEIRTGPGLDDESQVRAMEVLLDNLGYEGVGISASRVPLRIG